jgi:hypothetical protein
LEAVLVNVKNTIEKAEKPSPAPVEAVVETVEETVEAPKAKTTPAKK